MKIKNAFRRRGPPVQLESGGVDIKKSFRCRARLYKRTPAENIEIKKACGRSCPLVQLEAGGGVEIKKACGRRQPLL